MKTNFKSTFTAVEYGLTIGLASVIYNFLYWTLLLRGYDFVDPSVFWTTLNLGQYDDPQG